MRNNKRITIHIATRDRHSELALLLQSLRTQTYRYWDLVIGDESQTPVNNCHFLVSLFNRIKLEKHYVNTFNNDLKLGVCNIRNKIIENDYFDNPFSLRLDDDVILEPDYIEKLLKVIDLNFDIASGVTPLLGASNLSRDIGQIDGIINKKVLDDKGNIIVHGDDCGCMYNSEKILLAHEFRSNALIKKEVTDRIKYEINLSPVGFREEAFFSFRAQMEGFKIGVNTKAIAWHLVAPSGGCRFDDYGDKVVSDDRYFKKWIKEKYKQGKLKVMNI